MEKGSIEKWKRISKYLTAEMWEQEIYYYKGINNNYYT